MRPAAVIAAFLMSLAVPAVAAKDERPAATRSDVDAAITRGVDFLIASQLSNGAWGSPARTKGLNIYAPVPGAHHAFRAGATGLALSGLIDVADPRPEAHAAISAAAGWTTEHLPRLRRANQHSTYNVWGHAYGLRSITRLHALEEDPEKKSVWKALAREQIDLLNRYADISGGWGYLDIFDGITTQRPSGITTAFTTATVLLAMDEASTAMGLEMNKAVVARATASILRQRTPDFSYTYSDLHRMVPRRPINRPAGSLARSQACNAALRAFGDETVTDDRIREWTGRLFDREGWLDIGRKRPIPHETHFQISGYFYYYGTFYLTEAARFLPPEDRAEIAGRLGALLIERQEPDGSWWDYPLYDYHQPYGTGYALMALAWCRAQLP